MPVKFFISTSILFFMITSCSNSSNENNVANNKIEKISIGFNVQFDTSMNNADRQMIKDKDSIALTSSKETDFFIEPGGAYEKSDAPLLLKKIDNAKPFTFTAELKPEHKVKYDAGMLFIFV